MKKVLITVDDILDMNVDSPEGIRNVYKSDIRMLPEGWYILNLRYNSGLDLNPTIIKTFLMHKTDRWYHYIPCPFYVRMVENGA